MGDVNIGRRGIGVVRFYEAIKAEWPLKKIIIERIVHDHRIPPSIALIITHVIRTLEPVKLVALSSRFF